MTSPGGRQPGIRVHRRWSPLSSLGAGARALGEGGLDLRRMLGSSSFVRPLGSAGDGKGRGTTRFRSIGPRLSGMLGESIVTPSHNALYRPVLWVHCNRNRYPNTSFLRSRITFLHSSSGIVPPPLKEGAAPLQ